MRVGSVVARLLAFAVVAGCSADASGRDGALGSPSAAGSQAPKPASTAPVADSTAVVATDLAPSQIHGSTVPAPVTPVPCAVDDLEFWTAQVVPGASTVDAVIRIRNVGDVTCDADISRSPNLDPAIEPDVWLERGATADVYVGQIAPDCASPSVVDSIDLAIGDVVVGVPSVVVTCGWWLTAYYPNDPARNLCEGDALDVAVTTDAVVVRNGSAAPCGMAGVAEVDGASVAADRTRGPSIFELAPGDVVAFGRRSDIGCEGSNQVVLVDEGIGELVVDDVPCSLTFELGGGRPWFGAIDGPALADESFAAVVEALDPFDANE